MKNGLGKLIAIFALSTALVISLALNIFTYSFLGIHNMEDFKQVLLSKELLDAFTEVGTPEDNTNDTILDNDEDNNNQVEDNDSSDDSNIETGTTSIGCITLAYEGIVIKEIKTERSLLGKTITFLVENTTEESICVSFRDIYIDGYVAGLSGASVQDLKPGKKAYVDLTLWEADWEDFTNDPSTYEFTIVIYDPNNYDTLYEESFGPYKIVK
jgi:hypothetical protein